MRISDKGPSRLFKAVAKLPVWMYQAHLGSVFFGRLIAIVHRGRKSGNRYVSGLEVLDRRDGEVFVISAWGTRANWYRNIEANGIDELWDGNSRTEASFRVLAAGEVFDVLSDYESAHKRAAKFFFRKLDPGYDFTDDSRRTLAESSLLIAFTPSRS